MRSTSCIWLLAALFPSALVSAQTQKISPEGQKCLECHGSSTRHRVAMEFKRAREGGSGLLLMSPSQRD